MYYVRPCPTSGLLSLAYVVVLRLASCILLAHCFSKPTLAPTLKETDTPLNHHINRFQIIFILCLYDFQTLTSLKYRAYYILTTLKAFNVSTRLLIKYANLTIDTLIKYILQ